MKTILHNGRVITPHGLLDGYVLVEGDKILHMGSGPYSGDADCSIDVRGRYISPGFIDIHVHGGGGYDFMDGTVEAFLEASRVHMTHGTTSIVPTTLTCPDHELERVFACFEAASQTQAAGPNLIGLHLEGPYFSPDQAGAQDPAYLKTPEKGDYRRIFDACPQIVRMSAAPELPGALELGDEMRQRGILASIGHSNAEYFQVLEAVEHGYSHVTHLYSATSMLHRVGPYRHLGIVEAAYMSDDLTIEIIADGQHLPPELLRYILRFKPVSQICLITDAMRGAGLPNGTITKLGSLENGQDVILDHDVAMLMDKTAFAGSVCTADRCVRTIYRLAGASIEDAVRMITQNPARILGLSQKGSLAPGMDADLCVFDEEIRISDVFVMGRRTYQAGAREGMG